MQNKSIELTLNFLFLYGEKDGIYGNFQIGEWDFKVCEFEDSVYPKYFAIVAFHDEKCQLAYLEFYDKDLDVGVSDEEGMKEFIKENFNYDFEKKL